MVRSIKSAIEDGHLPKLIAQGSSGSYFCSGGNGEGGALGVFKPKDEEPYGEFNPKVCQSVGFHAASNSYDVSIDKGFSRITFVRQMLKFTKLPINFRSASLTNISIRHDLRSLVYVHVP